MAAIVGGLCTEILWRGYRFAMNDIKKSKNISGETYIQSSNANARVLLNLSIFWRAPGFLKLLSCGRWYAFVCVCVSAPRAIKNYSREMKSEYPIKQVLLLFSFSVRHLLSILLMGGALVTKRVVCYFQRRAR